MHARERNCVTHIHTHIYAYIHVLAFARAYTLYSRLLWYLRDAWKQDCRVVRFASRSVLVGYQLLQKLERVNVSRLTPRTDNGLSPRAIANSRCCLQARLYTEALSADRRRIRPF